MSLVKETFADHLEISRVLKESSLSTEETFEMLYLADDQKHVMKMLEAAGLKQKYVLWLYFNIK